MPMNVWELQNWISEIEIKIKKGQKRRRGFTDTDLQLQKFVHLLSHRCTAAKTQK